MIKRELQELISTSTFANLGFIDTIGMPNIRRVYCTWHKGIKKHLISTNTSSMHVQTLLSNNKACLYFENSEKFQGLCLTGKITVHHEPKYKELLWNEGDEKYYSKAVTDEDYCVLEFIAESGRYYMNCGSGNLSQEELSDKDYGTKFQRTW